MSLKDNLIKKEESPGGQYIYLGWGMEGPVLKHLCCRHACITSQFIYCSMVQYLFWSIKQVVIGQYFKFAYRLHRYHLSDFVFSA